MIRRRATRAPELPVSVEILDMTHDGRGVARVDGKAWFVSDALPGERVSVRRTRPHRHYDEAELICVEQASVDRVEPRCPHFGTCGGCVLQHMAAAAQIDAKQRVLAENFSRIGKLEPDRWLPPLHSDSWGYRRRGRLSARFVLAKNRLLLGFRERNGKFVADLAGCDVAHPAVGKHLRRLGEVLGSLSIPAAIPQVEFAAGDNAAVLVIRHLAPFTATDKHALLEFERESGLRVLLQASGPDSVVALHGPMPELHYAVDGGAIQLGFGALDFIQVNQGINEGMIAQAVALLDPSPTDHALDLFCGLGNFTLPLARRCAHVTGVEGDAALIERARRNAGHNGIANVKFEVADLFAPLTGRAWAQDRNDLVLLDPPRAGAQELLGSLPGKRVRRVVYVSCHPASLARDAAILCERHGFTLSSAGVMDMFPHTAHVESIAVFDRR